MLKEKRIDFKDLLFCICPKCGEKHNVGIGDKKTGEIEPIDICYACLWQSSGFKLIRDEIYIHD